MNTHAEPLPTERTSTRSILSRPGSTCVEGPQCDVWAFLQDLIDSRNSPDAPDVSADREVSVLDPVTGTPRRMLMFGSNNYLGLANHPYVREHVIRAIGAYGAGIGGPPLLNGTTRLHRELELRLAALKDRRRPSFRAVTSQRRSRHRLFMNPRTRSSTMP
jgi:hypothetical protein